MSGTGQTAEPNCKYPTQKYGSDIRVKDSGRYDLYINKSLTTYYIMSEGKSPTEAQEIVSLGEDMWYVSGTGEEARMRNVGVFLVATGVVLDAESNIKVEYDANKTYDIYIKVDILKIWVVESKQAHYYGELKRHDWI